MAVAGDINVRPDPKMTTKKKLFVLAVCLVALALAEQLLPITVCYSKMSSTTQVDSKITDRVGDLVSVVRVDKPLTRWLPFAKFGETVFHHTYQQIDGVKVIESEVTTRTRLFVLGLCSTAKYDVLALAPSELFGHEFLKK